MSLFLILHLEAPLMSFGGVAVDNRGVSDPFPGASLLTGLLGNALGLSHRDVGALGQLQARLRHAVRRDRPGQPIVDYQTVDLGQAHLVDTGWTTRGSVEKRAGAFSTGTHIRYRHYFADAFFTVALQLDPAEESPTLEDLAQALDQPARPLFIGRKCCLPSRPVLAGIVEAADLRAAVVSAPSPGLAAGSTPPTTRIWVLTSELTADGRTKILQDQRDWGNQIHSGARWYLEEEIAMGATHD